jgi:predicted nucleic acid-binding protein
VLNPVVVNASPLIVLGKTGYLDLLRLAGDPVQVPTAVIQEIQQAGPNDPVVQALARITWIQVVHPGQILGRLAGLGLGAGEEEVLTWAANNSGTEALIDDKTARRWAKANAIPHRGCLGLVIAARQQGVISAARPVLDSQRQAGLRLSDRIMNQSLALVGE